MSADRVLYANAISNYCAKTRIVLRYKGLEWREVAPPDGYGSAAYRKIIPAGSIPGLIDGELVLSESEAINEYLEDRYPDPPMLPPDPAGRAKARMITRWHDLWVEPPIRQLFRHMAPSLRDPAFVKDRVAAMQKRLDQLDDLITPAPFALGEAMTLADCPWPATFVMFDHMMSILGESWRLSPRLTAWRKHLEAHPAIAPEVSSYHKAAETWVAAKLALV
jgi:glutathione S-transferase